MLQIEGFSASEKCENEHKICKCALKFQDNILHTQSNYQSILLGVLIPISNELQITFKHVINLF